MTNAERLAIGLGWAVWRGAFRPDFARLAGTPPEFGWDYLCEDDCDVCLAIVTSCVTAPAGILWERGYR